MYPARLYLTYFILTAFFLVLLKAMGQEHFFSNFNMDIFAVADTIEILRSQRGLNTSEQIIILLFLPGIISGTFILHLWLYNSLLRKYCRNLVTLLASFPVALFLLKLDPGDPHRFVFFSMTGILIMVVFLIVFFQIRMFEFKYLSFHLFITGCALIGMTCVNRIRNEARDRLNSCYIPSLQNPPEPYEANIRKIFIDSVGPFDIFYVPLRQRALIIKKKDRKL